MNRLVFVAGAVVLLLLAAAAPASAIIGGRRVPRSQLHYLGAIAPPGGASEGPLGTVPQFNNTLLLSDPRAPFQSSCSLTLIAPRLVMSARHCFTGGGPLGSPTVLSGPIDDVGIGNYRGSLFAPFVFDVPFSGNPAAPPINTAIYDGQAPAYQGPGQWDPDISTFTLQATIRNIAPVPLPRSGAEEAALTAPGTPVIAAGYGLVGIRNGVGVDAKRLHEAAMTIVPCPSDAALDICAEPARHRGVGGVPPGGVCFGDSGGPLLSYSRQRRRLVEVGILSGSLVPGNDLFSCPGHPSFFTNIGVQLGWLDSVLASPLPPAYKVAGAQIPTIRGSIAARPFRPQARGTRRTFLGVGRRTSSGDVIAVHASELGTITTLGLTRTTKSVFPCPGSARRRPHRPRRLCFANLFLPGLRVAIKAPVTYLRITGYNGLNKLPPGRYRAIADVTPLNAYSGQGARLRGYVRVK